MTIPLSVTFRIRPWVRPVAGCAAVLGFILTLVHPPTGKRYTDTVIHWLVYKGMVVDSHHHACACAKDCESSCTCSCGAVLSMGPTYATDGRWMWKMLDGSFEVWT